MAINGREAQQHQLSYDKIIKHTLEQSDEMTIRFINGLFRDDISLDAPVEWLDKESVDGKYSAIVADFYPRVGGKMYAIEIEQDASGDMAVRVFRYTVGGAMLHGMAATKTQLNSAFPQPCVVFLTSTKNTPDELIWNIDFFDGQSVTLRVPAVRLSELSVKEIAERDLLPVGQFYLRKFEPLTDSKMGDFLEATKALLAEVRSAVDSETVLRHIGAQMEETLLFDFVQYIQYMGAPTSEIGESGPHILITRNGADTVVPSLVLEYRHFVVDFSPLRQQ